MNLPKITTFAILTLTALVGTASAVDFSGSYAENFDGLGTTGTALPTGFSLYAGDAGTTNSTWTAATGITANGATGSVASMVLNTNGLTATTTPSGTNNNGFNAATSSGNTGNRVVATSPTTVSGSAFDLTLTNTTGTAIDSLTLGYTIQRFTAASSANELPGYSVFFRLDSGAWTQLAEFTPTIGGAGGTVAVPNTVGITTVPATAFSLPATWAAGSAINLRWVDDNAVQTSPDQIIGLDNVTVTTVVPEPSTWVAVGVAASLGMILCQQRRAKV